MSHVRRKPSKHPGRVVKQRGSSKKISKTVRNVLIFTFLMVITVLSMSAVALLIIFS